MKLKRSDTIWIQGAVVGAILVGLIDWHIGTVMGFWPTVLVWLLAGGAWYGVALKLLAEKSLADRAK